MKLLVATTNPGKVREIQKLISDLPIELYHLGDPALPDMPESPETGATFEENAIQKARHYANLSKLVTVAEDAGLEIMSLNNWPGVHSSRVAESDPERVELALQKLKGKTGDDRRARFVSVVAFYDPINNRTETFTGTAEGVILEAPRGENGFGYDPIFFYPGLEKTFAELSSEEKNSVSHRGKSFQKFADYVSRSFHEG